MKSSIEILKEMEKGYTKHCEVMLAVLVAERTSLQAAIDEFHNKISKLNDRIEEFDPADPKMRQAYFSEQYASNKHAPAVDDFAKT